jgi:glycerol-3-phosphate dehydrogenase
VVIGTTDVAAPKPLMEPGHDGDEIGFLLETIHPYLARPIETSDILSVFSGLRPLVSGGPAKTSKLSREHHIEASAHGLITVAGGKWTTYRRMAEDAIDFACKHGMLEKRSCISSTISLRGAGSPATDGTPYLREYGTDATTISESILEDDSLGKLIDPALPYTFAEVRYAVQSEMARTVEDVLSRRTRSLLLDSAAAARAAQAVASLMAAELGRDETWVNEQVSSFRALQSRRYSLAAELEG